MKLRCPTIFYFITKVKRLIRVRNGTVKALKAKAKKAIVLRQLSKNFTKKNLQIQTRGDICNPNSVRLSLLMFSCSW